MSFNTIYKYYVSKSLLIHWFICKSGQLIIKIMSAVVVLLVLVDGIGVSAYVRY